MMEDQWIRNLKNAIKNLPRGLREPKTVEIFERVYYLDPIDYKVINYPRQPTSVTSPGVVLINRMLYIYPEVSFNVLSFSSIGVFKVSIERILEKSVLKPLGLRILLWSTKPWEEQGYREPLASYFSNNIYLAYSSLKVNGEALPVITILDRNLVPKNIVNPKIIFLGKIEYPKVVKNLILLDICRDKSPLLLTLRSSIVGGCWYSNILYDTSLILSADFKPVIAPENWEKEVKWITNPLKISSNEYLVGWQSITNEGRYFNGLALIDDSGQLLAVSNYLLTAKTLVEVYGDKPGVIGGGGLVKYKEYIMWIGGLSGYGIGFYIAKEDKVFNALKRV